MCAIVGNSLNPPYTVQIDGHVIDLSEACHAHFPIAFRKMSESEFVDFLTNGLTSPAAANIDGIIHLVQRQISHNQT